MVILFCDKNSVIEKEIIEILKRHGFNAITDQGICILNKNPIILSAYKKTRLNLERGIAVFCDNTNIFRGQFLPKNIVGICEQENHTALQILKDNKSQSIVCGVSPLSSVTISSIKEGVYLITLQRTVSNCYGKDIEPSEFKITLSEKYNPFSVMASLLILLLESKNFE